jgi:hypothetical protein
MEFATLGTLAGNKEKHLYAIVHCLHGNTEYYSHLSRGIYFTVSIRPGFGDPVDSARAGSNLDPEPDPGRNGAAYTVDA